MLFVEKHCHVLQIFTPHNRAMGRYHSEDNIIVEAFVLVFPGAALGDSIRYAPNPTETPNV